MRGAIFASGAIHVSVLILILAVRGASPIVVPGPEVVQVALIEPSMAQVWSPPPPEESKTQIEPHEEEETKEEGIKVAPEPVKKKVAPEPVKKVEARKETAPATRAAALPYAAVGSAGLSGQISVDAADFEFTYYLILVRNRIAQNWTPPGGTGSAEPVRAIIYFRIGRDGTISSARIETGSSFEYFDRSALRAVVISDPLPPLPLGYSGSDLGVHFGFQYTEQ